MKTFAIVSALAALSVAGWVFSEPSDCRRWKFETQYVTQSKEGKIVTKREGRWACIAGPLADAEDAVDA